jgi:TonB family protein
MLVGKSLYLRGGYLDNSLEFDEHGQLISHSPQGSYTLCGIEVDKIRLTKHKVELDGARYGLHFLGALPYEDPTKAVDRVKITPKKKFVRITIDREQVITPKKKKEKEKSRDNNAKVGPGGAAIPAESAPQPAPETAVDTPETSGADEAKSELAGTEQAGAQTAPAAEDEPAAAPGSVTTTTSPAHAAKVLKEALDKIFSDGLDESMMAAMPDFWKLYYQAAAAHTDNRPSDPSVLRQGQVDQKAKLLSVFQPESNDFAQNAGVAGMSLYHAVIGADGRPEQIAVARPIGFGLDESAVAAIRKATFQPAIKDGKPVPVLLDLVVEFRIYSKRTNVAGESEDRNKPQSEKLPGPYTMQDSILRTHDQAQSQAPNPPQSQ